MVIRNGWGFEGRVRKVIGNGYGQALWGRQDDRNWGSVVVCQRCARRSIVAVGCRTGDCQRHLSESSIITTSQAGLWIGCRC